MKMVELYAAHVDAKLKSGAITAAQVEQHRGKLDMDVSEHCLFQERKSLAQASGKLTLEEAQTVYAYLGNTVTTFNEQPIAVKAVLTNLFAELLGVKS